MNATPHIIESALLLLVAFLLGCVVGYFARRFSGRSAPAAPAPQATPLPVEPAPVRAPVTSIPAAETPPAAKPVPAGTARKKPAAKKPAPAPKAPKSQPLPDDLKKIRGIGPRIEAGLNSHGVYRYAQIARWSRKRITELDTHLTLRGRIDREQWVEQAKALSKAAK
ncbi:hypothetical protein [Pelagibacterium sediminicola]|uniref:hypothetical protein n=1 Tax=Pelagibacterium sediminicola TaxID=2248761 RepID=UPI000E321806|nr:hypothetical protein [Pelagibacterium sediminicola]